MACQTFDRRRHQQIKLIGCGEIVRNEDKGDRLIPSPPKITPTLIPTPKVQAISTPNINYLPKTTNKPIPPSTFSMMTISTEKPRLSTNKPISTYTITDQKPSEKFPNEEIPNEKPSEEIPDEKPSEENPAEETPDEKPSEEIHEDLPSQENGKKIPSKIPHDESSDTKHASYDDDDELDQNIDILLKYGLAPIVATVLGLGSLTVYCKFKYKSGQGVNFCIEICPPKKDSAQENYPLQQTPEKIYTPAKDRRHRKPRTQETSFMTENADDSRSTTTTSLSPSRERSPETLTPQNNPKNNPPPPPPRKMHTRSQKISGLMELDINAPSTKPTARNVSIDTIAGTSGLTYAEIHPPKIPDRPSLKKQPEVTMDVSALMKEPQSLGVEALFKDSSSDASSSIYHDISFENENTISPGMTPQKVSKHVNSKKKATEEKGKNKKNK